MKLSNNFDLVEFVPKDLYDVGEDYAIRFVDMRCVALAQYLKDLYKTKVTINDWAWGGTYNDSGFRTQRSKYWTPLSPHSRGLSIDVKIEKYDAETIRKNIRNNYADYKKLGLTIIEKDTPTWVHLSVETTGKDFLVEVSPK